MSWQRKGDSQREGATNQFLTNNDRPTTSYSDFFGAAFSEHEPGDRQPFDYQLRLTTDDQLPSLV